MSIWESSEIKQVRKTDGLNMPWGCKKLIQSGNLINGPCDGWGAGGKEDDSYITRKWVDKSKGR